MVKVGMVVIVTMDDGDMGKMMLFYVVHRHLIYTLYGCTALYKKPVFSGLALPESF